MTRPSFRHKHNGPFCVDTTRNISSETFPEDIWIWPVTLSPGVMTPCFYVSFILPYDQGSRPTECARIVKEMGREREERGEGARSISLLYGILPLIICESHSELLLPD